MTTPQAGDAQTPDEGARYWIDPARFAELRRSMEVTLLTRRCATCLDQPADNANPPPVQAQIDHILECCSKDDSFIKASMPLQEIVFRLILKEGNTPLTLSHLHYQITEEWATPASPMNISADGLKRVLDNDDFYGFRSED